MTILEVAVDTPEDGMLLEGTVGEQPDERHLEHEQRHKVANDTECKRETEALDRADGDEEQREGGDERDEVGVDRGADRVTDARERCGLDRTAHADLLLDAFEHEDGGVRRQADREHDTRHAGHRQREQAVMREHGQEAEIENREHAEVRNREQPKSTIEEQQVDCHDREADTGREHALGKRVLTEGGTDDTRLGEDQVHGKSATLENGLERLGLIHRVVARDLDLTVGDGGLHRRGRVHDAIEHDGDLPMCGHEVGRDIGKGLGAGVVELEVHRVVSARLARLAHGDTGKRIARHECGVGAGLQRNVLLATRDRRKGVLVGDGAQVDELERSGLADGGDGLIRIGQAGDLDQDVVGTLSLHRRLAGTELVDTVGDDGHRLVELLGGHCAAIDMARSHRDRQPALDIETLGDPLVERREADDACHQQDRDEHQQADVLLVGLVQPPPALLLALLLSHRTPFR